MANMAHSISLEQTAPATETTAAGELRFDWIVMLLSIWFVGGLYLDGWAHNHLPSTLETFFTPWHGVFYSGFLAVTLYMLFTLVRNHQHGAPWLQALPAGYNLSLVGAGVFAIGGVGDLLWHQTFGIEKGVEALLSPTHLTLATGIALIVSGPFRAAWRRAAPPTPATWSRLGPMVLSLTFTFSLFTFMTMFSNPFNYPWAGHNYQWRSTFLSQAIGVDAVLIQTSLMMGLILLTLRRWQLPPGTLTFMLGINSMLMSTLEDDYHFWVIPFAILGGLVADLLLWRLKPSTTRPDILRAFAFLMPTTVYLIYFLGTELTQGLAWSIHMWMGTAVLAGIVGVLLSYLVLPPPVPEPTDPTANG